MPEGTTVEFAAAVPLREFDDGWKLVELRTKADLDTFGKAMRNCWTGTWEHQIAPGPEGEDPKEAALEEARRRWDRPEYRKAYGDEWVEAHIKADAQKPGRRAYKLVALVDNDGNLRAGSSLGLRDVRETIVYGSCDALAQKGASWVTLDGLDFCVLELLPCNSDTAYDYRTYTYNVTGEALDHFTGWYRDVCGGEWQDSATVQKLASYA